MKYVILEDENGGKHPFIFPEACSHAVFAQVMKQLMLKYQDTSTHVYSAGFWNHDKASGDSESLGVKSAPADTAYILMGQSISHMPEEVANQLLDQWRNR